MSTQNQWLDRIQWNDQGLIPVVTQETGTNIVLMLAWMNREALLKTIESGQAIYWSRSRNKIWAKGEESGHIQKIIDIRLDCDEDTILLEVEQIGGIACHTGRHSCFYQKFTGNITNGEWTITEPVLKNPNTIYK